MKTSKAATYLMTSLMLLPACNKDAVENIVPEQQEPELSNLDILFRAGVEQEGGSVATRGTMMGNFEADLPNDDDEEQPWHTWPWITGDEFTANALYYFDSMTLLGQSFMHNLCVSAQAKAIVKADETDSYNDSSKTVDWSYAPVKQWPNQGYLDFFSYYPSKEMLSKMRINVAYDDTALRLPTEMEEDADDFTEPPAPSAFPRSSRGGAELLPAGISSLRFWHESPLDTVITFRCKMHPAAIDPPMSTEEGVMNSEPVIEYNDATVQPDLMFAHHPHMAKPSVSNKVQMSFTHSMMAVRFWLKGADRRDDDDSGNLQVGSRFRNISDFCINSVSFGPVYVGGECVAYDNTDWQAYYQHLNEATHYSDEHVKLRYVWKYGEEAPSYTVKQADGSTVDYTMAPPYGGCEYRIPLPYGNVCDYHAPIPSNTPLVAPQLIDPAYPLPDVPLTDIFTQRCDFSVKDCIGDIPFSEDATKTAAGWQPSLSTPILPILDSNRGVSSKYSAFIIPPQMFLRSNPYVKITYTITETTNGGATPDKLTSTTETVAIPMATSYINIEDGEILDLYFTFDLDGDDFFKFFIDAQVNPWQPGGQHEDEWTNW